MPKIIENLESRLIAEARQQISENGYGSMTIRSVAKACGVGVGTVYNYFPSKDDITAAFMLEDWQKCMTVIEAVSRYSDSSKNVARCIYDQLVSYSLLYQSIFRDESALNSFSGSFSKYHGLLREQISRPLRKFCRTDFQAEFIGEALLTWTVAGKDFEEIFSLIEKLFKE